MSRSKKITAITVVAYMLLTNVAAAQDANYGKRAGDWAVDQLEALWLAAVACGACMFLFPGTRKPGILVGFIAAVFLTGVIVFAPETVEGMIKGVAKVVSGT